MDPTWRWKCLYRLSSSLTNGVTCSHIYTVNHLKPPRTSFSCLHVLIRLHVRIRLHVVIVTNCSESRDLESIWRDALWEWPWENEDTATPGAPEGEHCHVSHCLKSWTQHQHVISFTLICTWIAPCRSPGRADATCTEAESSPGFDSTHLLHITPHYQIIKNNFNKTAACFLNNWPGGMLFM